METSMGVSAILVELVGSGMDGPRPGTSHIGTDLFDIMGYTETF